MSTTHEEQKSIVRPLPEGVEHTDALEEFRGALIPADDEYVPHEEIVRRGRFIVQMAHISYVLLGELSNYVIQREDTENVDKLIGQMAYEWGCRKSTVYRAWAYTSKHPKVPRPQDLPQGMTGEALQMAETEEEADELLEKMVAEDWGARELREMRRLQSWDLLPRLVLVELGWNEETGQVWAQAGGKRLQIGKLDIQSENWLVKAGVKLLMYRARGGVG